MGKRREPRKPIEVPVRIFGTDSGGKIFSENVTTVDVSHSGAKLGGVRARVKARKKSSERRMGRTRFTFG